MDIPHIPKSLAGIFGLAALGLGMDMFVFGTLGLDNYAGFWGNTPHVH